MTLKIQTWYNNPILRKISDEIVDFKDAKKIEKEMKDFLNNEENWVGLAGPQVWIMKRIFIAQFDKKRNTTVVNPKIIDFWSKKTISQEWCLSLFWVWADVERSKNIPEWQLLLEKKITPIELRKEFVHSTTNSLNALGIVGRIILFIEVI